ncbi:DNA mismatch repair protein MutS [Candidatus Dojkabacteria bacterium]|nr:DNA mismatch repair protein MutS [Candidatus Dojkabacteria bacterium]
MDVLTPMQKQYMEIKQKHKDAILLFRLGDFYEAFYDDAKIVSDILDITLTGRGKGDTRVPMAGIPYHAIDNYLYKLVHAGYKVAIAEQLTEPEAGKIVERSVTKIVTSGTFTDSKTLRPDQNNFLACVHVSKDKKQNNLALLDLTTGEFELYQFDSFKQLKNEVGRASPSEILLSEKYKNIDMGFRNSRMEYLYDSDFNIQRAYEHLIRQFSTSSLKGFGFKGTEEVLIPAGVLISYSRENQKTNLEHVSKLKQIETANFMNLDTSTIYNLELVSNIRDSSNKNTLFSILNQCSTSMGMRMLRNWILLPLLKKKDIEDRLNSVEYGVKNLDQTNTIKTYLKEILDIERLISRIGTGYINGRDLIGLKYSLLQVRKISELINNTKLPEYIEKLSKIFLYDNYSHIVELIDESINDDCPVEFSNGGIIKTGYNKEIDEIKGFRNEGSEFINNLQQKEIQRTGISNLKIKFNKVFGYYIEITNSHADKIPTDYIRKQTLVNAERYITPELKEFEEKVLTANEKLVTMELDVFTTIVNTLKPHIPLIQTIAKDIAQIDIFINFALLASHRNYVKPSLNNDSLIIEQGRHPVVELMKGENYIPNDIKLNDNKTKIVILTGPNMSGKSTYIRQIALISLMAQIGSFVPAKHANLRVFDRIFTRVGASDNLSAGESTFMVEMNEAANILNNATKDSLIILDEVGRGTSTYDGVAIAWSIVEYINDKIGANILFATHYHELIQLSDSHKNISNFHVAVIDEGENVIFTHKISPGGMNRSYGVHVAQMAGVPNDVILNAKKILSQLENNNKTSKKSFKKLKNSSINIPQFSLFK